MKPTKSGTASIRADRMLRRRTPLREARPPCRRAESAAGHRLSVLRSSVVAAVAIALIAAAPAHAAKVENLQKLGKLSYFAYVEKAVPAKAQPKTSARTVGKLTLRTGEKTDDLVSVIARTTDSKDRVWLQVRLPIRPNGTTGWVQETALSELQPVDTWLKISTKTYKATVIKNGKRVFSANVGVGQPQWPTPHGPVLRAREADGLQEPGLRAARVRHERDLGHA